MNVNGKMRGAYVANSIMAEVIIFPRRPNRSGTGWFSFDGFSFELPSRTFKERLSVAAEKIHAAYREFAQAPDDRATSTIVALEVDLQQV